MQRYIFFRKLVAFLLLKCQFYAYFNVFFKPLSPLNSLFFSVLTYIKWNIWNFMLMYINSILELCSVRFGCRLFSLWMPSSSAYLWDNNNIMFLCARANVCYSFIFLGFCLIFTLKWFFSTFNGVPCLFAKTGENSFKIPTNCL